MQVQKKDQVVFSVPRRATRSRDLALALAAVGGAVGATSAHADLDTATIKTAIESNTSKGQEVGGYVIGAVVALVVVSIIIMMVRKV
ncbi:hypothetical protein GO594_11985 [Pseudomonas otitidis]|uniref:Bacteriophage coat protein B n=1 Tax=Metapseudomonas otitidis TaxID=319939 RepID=A0A7X3H7A0_9GAMM|nr:major capsid protein [Pseudomonas otitidis]MWK56687.1 hypothetical protein [Pseudomonas otitidis]MWK56698.1 hypothetical protein [Pseudomonas otitidis]